MDKASKTSECDNSEGKFDHYPTCTIRIKAEIDEFIKYTHTSVHDIELAVQWVNWEELSDIKKIGEGGFGSVYSTCWSKNISSLRKENEIVALKTIGKPNNLMNDFLKEVIWLFF
jgi:hypothetical protein